jgi:hypothetical protein
MFKRFFAFGCSFTNWRWPTWADIISWDLNVPYQNWGMGGLGNVGIFHRMVESDLKNNLDKQDLVITLWSHWNREDRYLNGGWEAHGNVFNNGLYDKRFLSKYWSLENDIVKNSTSIIAANKMFDINFQGHIIPPAEFESNSKIFNEQETTLLNFYKKHFSTDNVFGMRSTTAYTHIINDTHPDLLLHLDYVKTKIYPKLGLTLKQETVEVCNSIQKDILSLLRPDDQPCRDLVQLKQLIRRKYNLPFKENNYGF